MSEIDRWALSEIDHGPAIARWREQQEREFVLIDDPVPMSCDHVDGLDIAPCPCGYSPDVSVLESRVPELYPWRDVAVLALHSHKVDTPCDETCSVYEKGTP